MNKFYFYIKGGLICVEEQCSGTNLTLAYFTQDQEGFNGISFLLERNPHHELLYSTTVPSMIKRFITRAGEIARKPPG